MGKTAMGWFGRLATAAVVAAACAVLMPQVAGAGERIRFSTSFGPLLKLSGMVCNFRCYNSATGPDGNAQWSATVDFDSRPLRRRGKAMLRVPQWHQRYVTENRTCFDTPLTVNGIVVMAAPGLCGQLAYITMKLNPRQKRDFGLGDSYYLVTLMPQNHGPGPWFNVYFDITPAPNNDPDNTPTQYTVKGFWNETRFTDLPEFDAQMRYVEGNCRERVITLD